MAIPVASLVPFEQPHRRWLSRADLVRRLAVSQADAGLRDVLAGLTGDATDGLEPVQGVGGLEVAPS
jgi:antitoxin (DNA-binding transcriptional repressor) of toxin-antitoxin stability system